MQLTQVEFETTRMKVLVSILAVVVSSSCSLHLISPLEQTVSAMGETFVRMNLYAQQNGTVPLSLAVLPLREGYVNATTDAWDRPLLYEISDVGILTLRSLGKDGEPGGNGDNADISQSYHSRRSYGSLWIGEGFWIVEAETQDSDAN